MPFILNNVRKPKSVGKVFVKSEKHGNGFNSITLKNALTGRCLVNNMADNVNKIFSKKDLEIIERLKFTLGLSETPKKVCLMFGSYDKANKGFECSIYFIDVKNLLLEKCEFNSWGLRSDTIVISPKAWFEDQEVYSTKHQIFFDKYNGALIAAVHPKDINDLKKDPNMIFVGEGNAVENDNGEVVLSNVSSLKIMKASDREKLDLEERNKQRLLGVLGKQSVKTKNQNGVEVVCFDEKENKSNKNIVFSNIDLDKFLALPLGKYRLFLTEENKEVWFVIEEAIVLGEKQKQYAVIEQGVKEDYLDGLKERKPSRFFNK